MSDSIFDATAEPESTPTGRTVRVIEAGQRGDLAHVAREVAQLRRAIESDRAARRAEAEARDRSAGWWRWGGGIAATIALSLGGYAVRLASEASTDHVRVGDLTVAVHEYDGRLERLLEQQAHAAATLEQVSQALAEMRTDVRELRAESRRQTGDRR